MGVVSASMSFLLLMSATHNPHTTIYSTQLHTPGALQLDITRGQLDHNSASPPVIVYSLALNPRECKHLCLLVLDHNPRRCQLGALQLDITLMKIGKAIASGVATSYRLTDYVVGGWQPSDCVRYL